MPLQLEQKRGARGKQNTPAKDSVRKVRVLGLTLKVLKELLNMGVAEQTATLKTRKEGGQTRDAMETM